MDRLTGNETVRGVSNQRRSRKAKVKGHFCWGRHTLEGAGDQAQQDEHGVETFLPGAVEEGAADGFKSGC